MLVEIPKEGNKYGSFLGYHTLPFLPASTSAYPMKRRLIKQGQEKGEIRKQEDNQYKANIPKELADIGFTPKKFSTYKHIADIPEQDFKAFGKYYRELEDKKDVKLSLSKLTMISDKQQVQEEIGKFRKAGIAPFGHLIYKSSF